MTTHFPALRPTFCLSRSFKASSADRPGSSTCTITQWRLSSSSADSTRIDFPSMMISENKLFSQPPDGSFAHANTSASSLSQEPVKVEVLVPAGSSRIRPLISFLIRVTFSAPSLFPGNPSKMRANLINPRVAWTYDPWSATLGLLPWRSEGLGVQFSDLERLTVPTGVPSSCIFLLATGGVV